MAQIITATQMVVEEKFLKQHDIPPLQVVGWEGMFKHSLHTETHVTSDGTRLKQTAHVRL